MSGLGVCGMTGVGGGEDGEGISQVLGMEGPRGGHTDSERLSVVAGGTVCV